MCFNTTSHVFIVSVIYLVLLWNKSLHSCVWLYVQMYVYVGVWVFTVMCCMLGCLWSSRVGLCWHRRRGFLWLECVWERLPETSLIRAQCRTVRGADTKPAQIPLQPRRPLSAGWKHRDQHWPILIATPFPPIYCRLFLSFLFLARADSIRFSLLSESIWSFFPRFFPYPSYPITYSPHLFPSAVLCHILQLQLLLLSFISSPFFCTVSLSPLPSHAFYFSLYNKPL